MKQQRRQTSTDVQQSRRAVPGQRENSALEALVQDASRQDLSSLRASCARLRYQAHIASQPSERRQIRRAYQTITAVYNVRKDA